MSETSRNAKLDLDAIRQRLASARGKAYWRTLDEAADSPAFREFAESEFSAAFTEPPDRRQLLKVMAASLCLAGLTACSRLPRRTIAPYVTQGEEIQPGEPLYYATAMQMGTRATGLLIESHLGRPTKAEGNPTHPASLGATDIFSQASILSLWDPDRAKTATRGGEPVDWGRFVELAATIRGRLAQTRGARFRLLTGTVLSPSLAAEIARLLAEYPEARWVQYEPVNRDMARQGAIDAFGEDVNGVLRVDQADVILSLDADFLNAWPGSLAYARAFATRRRPESSPMNRLYVVEPAYTVTGSNADHRFRAKAGDVPSIAQAVAARVGVQTPAVNAPAWVDAVVRDLLAHRGRSLVVAGEFQPPAVHALAHAMNQALGNAGRTIVYTEPIEPSPGAQLDSLRTLVGEMRAGKVDDLLIVDCNPVYAAQADIDFAGALSHVPLRIQASIYEDETANVCHWHLPLSHFLEAWSDTRAYDGTCSIVQPLIEPLYSSRSSHEIIAMLRGDSLAKGMEMVQRYWLERRGGDDFDQFWRRSLHDGVIAGTAFPPKTVTAKAFPGAERPSSGLELVIRPDPTVYDGRFANNGWLQELPKPITTITWDNVAHVSPATAQAFGLENGDVVELAAGGRSVTAPAWIAPGQADHSVTVHLGYGRTHCGHVGEGVGFNAYRLMSSAMPWSLQATLRKTGRRYELAVQQKHQLMEGRELVRAATLAEYQANPGFAQQEEPAPASGLTLYPGYPYHGYRWGMVIDLSTCIGCNACTIACQAENNIAVVGKDEVARGRIMHWIRVDSYYHGKLDAPAVYHEPVPCMHCENAPCEVVCPVGATVHSDEGINQMVYNRCVGTRYCSNNCPYKVRRFNFFQFADYETPSLKGARNPDVTVRSRGVMEKCTYCIQRIEEAKIRSQKEDRAVKDGEVKTACQQVCPADAIVFGDLNNRTSRVAQLAARSRNYGLLTELNTRPRTTYLARVTNPNPGIKET